MQQARKRIGGKGDESLDRTERGLYIKCPVVQHYEGDVQDLDLSFSLNEDCMGKLVTHELVPGGKAVPVTNVNKQVDLFWKPVVGGVDGSLLQDQLHPPDGPLQDAHADPRPDGGFPQRLSVHR